MSDIVKHQGTTLALSDIMQYGEIFAKSGLFADAKDAAKAIVKIQAGAEMGIQPFQAMSGIHVIVGKPVVGAGIIASRIKASGKYDYDVVKLDNTIASIDFFENGKKKGNSTFTIEDAKKADTKNMGKFPKNMLFARAISNGQKWYAPDVFDGPVYVPEEMPTMTVDGTYEEVPDDPAENRQSTEPSQPETQPESVVNAIKIIEDKTDYRFLIETATSQDELKKIWKKVPKDEKPDLLALLKQMDIQLSNQNQESKK